MFFVLLFFVRAMLLSVSQRGCGYGVERALPIKLRTLECRFFFFSLLVKHLFWWDACICLRRRYICAMKRKPLLFCCYLIGLALSPCPPPPRPPWFYFERLIIVGIYQESAYTRYITISSIHVTSYPRRDFHFLCLRLLLLVIFGFYFQFLTMLKAFSPAMR